MRGVLRQLLEVESRKEVLWRTLVLWGILAIYTSLLFEDLSTVGTETRALLYAVIAFCIPWCLLTAIGYIKMWRKLKW